MSGAAAQTVFNRKTHVESKKTEITLLKNTCFLLCFSPLIRKIQPWAAN
jgi:hypothetical protein